MKIALNLEAASWLGGTYYLRNLALALRAHAPSVEIVTVGAPSPAFADLAANEPAVPPNADVVFPNWGLRRSVPAAEIHWIPDLQHRALPGNFGLVDRLRRDRGYRRLAARARLVVVSSEVARAEAARAYPRWASKLRVVHFASSSQPEGEDPGPVLARLGLPERFLLLPNQFWAHKNHRTAFAAVPELELPLVCTGETADPRRPEYFRELESSLAATGLAERVRILGVLERSDYLALVRAAPALVQPSLFEGWSSTVEDAKAYGRPIALSDIPVHREQAPPLAQYFEALDPHDLARAAAAAAATLPLAPEEARRRQAERSARYAERFLEVAREAVSSR